MLLNSLTFSTIKHNWSYSNLMKFSLLGILRSYNTPNVLLHFINPTLIRWFSSSSISPSLWIIDPRYRKASLFGISWPSNLTTPSSLFLLLLNLHSLYLFLSYLAEYKLLNTRNWIKSLMGFQFINYQSVHIAFYSCNWLIKITWVR